MTLRGRWYLAVPAKSAICISVYILYIFCVVKFKFNVILNAGSGSLAICGCVSKEIRRYTSRHVRIFSSRDEFLVSKSSRNPAPAKFHRSWMLLPDLEK